MKTLVLIPSSKTLRYAYFVRGTSTHTTSGNLRRFRGAEASQEAIDEINKALILKGYSLECGENCLYDLVAIRVCYGGKEFSQGELVTSDVVRKLERLTEDSPIHIPAVLSLIGEVRRAFSTVPVVLVFETSFFARLPVRESCYALDDKLLGGSRLRRTGFHGIFHTAAVQTALLERDRADRSRAKRILSICLDRRSEVCAVAGRTPLTVTSGVTPLEGLPGERTCGEIDPSIVLSLSQELGLGPEEINDVLSHQSGILGMTGRRISISTLFKSSSPEVVAARDVFQYRLLLAAGSGISAMGGIDHIVFSGRYSRTGRLLEHWLLGKIAESCRSEAPRPQVSYCTDSLDRLVANQAIAASRQAELTEKRVGRIADMRVLHENTACQLFRV